MDRGYVKIIITMKTVTWPLEEDYLDTYRWLFGYMKKVVWIHEEDYLDT